MGEGKGSLYFLYRYNMSSFMMIERRTEKSYNGLRRMSGKRLRLEGNSLKVLD